jgi:SAM-dependent methyltransferase
LIKRESGELTTGISHLYHLVVAHAEHNSSCYDRQMMNLLSRCPNSATQNVALEGKKVLLIAVLVIATSSCNAFLREGELLSRQRYQQNTRHIESTSQVQKQLSSRLHALIPEENPFANPETRSISGVRFASVLSGMDKLFSPQDLDRRNALSRTDGYWPYIQKGEDPPQQFTYGEFDFYFFAQLLDRAHEIYFGSKNNDNSDNDKVQSDWQDKVFVDIGSGTGRLALAAAGLHPSWRKCRGVELLPGLHKAAEENLESCQRSDQQGYALTATNDETGVEESLPLAPIEFTCGSFDDPYVYFGDADCVFVFSSCMSEALMGSLSKSIGRQCKPGAIVITTEFMLPLEGTIDPFEADPRVPSGSYELQLVEKVEGWCWLTGGESTAYIHRVVKSLWKDGSGELEAPDITTEDMAFRAITDAESEKMNNLTQFKRGVYNNMAFYEIPEAWRPKLDGQ